MENFEQNENVVLEKINSSAEAISDKDVIVMAVPSPFVRQTARLIKDYVKDGDTTCLPVYMTGLM